MSDIHRTFGKLLSNNPIYCATYQKCGTGQAKRLVILQNGTDFMDIQWPCVKYYTLLKKIAMEVICYIRELKFPENNLMEGFEKKSLIFSLC